MEEYEKPEQPKQIQLMVLSEQYAIVKFRVRTTVKMKKLMSVYLSRAGIRLGRISFIYEGQVINDDDTPESLELADGAVIEVYKRMTGA